MIKGVPYDAEVEYLESTGTQYILLPANNYNGIDIMLEPADGSTYGNIGRRTGTRADSICFTTTTGWIFRAYSSVVQTNDTNRSLRHATVHGTTATLDGVSYTLANGWNTLALAGSPFALFGLYNPTTQAMYYLVNCKIGACALYVGSEKVYDFISVRKGTVGYLYDRVTRRLFGNAGTGAFTLGPDVATPVMSLHRMWSPTAKSYIQNGLVAMWDGIENGGFGVKNLSATKWIDCIEGYEIDIPSGGSDTYSWSGTSLRRIGTGGIGPDISGLNQTSNADAWTIEIGMSMTTPVVAPSGTAGYQFSNFSINNGARQIRIFSTGNLNVIVTPDANWYHMPGVSLPFSRRTFTLGKTSIETATAGRYEAFVGSNGSLMTGTRLSRCALGGQMSLFAVSAWAETTDAEILFIRRYHRALTAAEIAYNYNIDRLRFGIGGAS